jgi:hypothetical protein
LLDQFYAPIFRAALVRVIGSNRPGIAKTLRAQPAGVDAVRDQPSHDSLRALPGKDLVRRLLADIVGVTFHAELQVRTSFHHFHDFAEHRLGVGQDSGFTGLEIDAG